MTVLTMAVEQSASTIVLTNALGDIAYVNPRFTELTGYTREEVVGRNPRMLSAGETPPEVYRTMWTTIAAGSEWRGELRNRRKDGTLYWESLTISPIRNEAGTITHYVAIEDDITERKELERKLKEALAELERSNAALADLNVMKDKFLAMAAHDLRNPIARIRFAAEIQLESPVSSEESRELLEKMVRACDAMIALINDLLDISKINSGRVELKPTSCEMKPFIEGICAENAILARKKGIEIVSQLAPDLKPVELDPRRVRQVLENLLSNAIKFSHSGTRILVSAKDCGDFMEVSVDDQGQGIRPEDVPRLFGEFQRVATRATAGEHSTGLGLAISKRIVELHHGHISVETQLGRGSCFRFTLPYRFDAGLPE